jgi:hypothetical protein
VNSKTAFNGIVVHYFVLTGISLDWVFEPFPLTFSLPSVGQGGPTTNEFDGVETIKAAVGMLALACMAMLTSSNGKLSMREK